MFGFTKRREVEEMFFSLNRKQRRKHGQRSPENHAFHRLKVVKPSRKKNKNIWLGSSQIEHKARKLSISLREAAKAVANIG